MAKKIAYNVSTINYLWQAENLALSFLRHNLDYDFYVCLVDKPNPSFDFDEYNFSFRIIWIDELKVDMWDKMVEYYTLFELVMSTKALALEYLFNNYNPDFAIYLDGDILVYDNFSLIEKNIETHNIFITPYCNSPMPIMTPIDKVLNGFSAELPFEDRLPLYVGIYNLGFIAVKNTPETKLFRDWWIKTSKNQCFIGRKQGLFGEQLCINLVPLYFEKVFIITHLGYNVSAHNLHERTITTKENKFYINGDLSLVFFHYSGYEYKQPHKVAKWIPLTFDERPDVKPVFADYHKTYLEQKWDKIKSIPCAFVKIKQEIIDSKKVIWKEPLRYKILRRLVSFLPKSIQADLKHITNALS